MAIANSDWTVTQTWTKVSTSDTGDFIFYNEAQPQDSIPRLDSNASEAIRWAFAASTPTARGNIVYPGCAFARGTVVGHVWVKTNSGTKDIPGQKSE